MIKSPLPLFRRNLSISLQASYLYYNSMCAATKAGYSHQTQTNLASRVESDLTACAALKPTVNSHVDIPETTLATPMTPVFAAFIQDLFPPRLLWRPHHKIA